MRTAESYSQGLPSVGRASQQELQLPRKLIIFNLGRRKEGGEGEGLREMRREGRREEQRGGGGGRRKGEMGEEDGERGGKRKESAGEGRGKPGRRGEGQAEAQWRGGDGEAGPIGVEQGS